MLGAAQNKRAIITMDTGAKYAGILHNSSKAELY